MSTDTNKIEMEVICPLNGYVLVRKDDNRKETKGGIALPDDMEIPVLTGRIIGMDPLIEDELGIKELDKVIVRPGNAMQVDFENERVYLLPAHDIIAVIRKNKAENE